MNVQRQKGEIQKYLDSHTAQSSSVSQMILGLDDLLVMDVDRTGEDINKPIIYYCRPNLQEIYSGTYGVPVCPYCGRNTKSPQQYREKDYDDAPIDNRRVILRVYYNTFRCSNYNCDRTFAPPLSCIDDKGRMTSRLKKMIINDAFSRKRTFASVAEQYHVSDTMVHKLFSDEVGRRSADTLYCAQPHLCIDEVLIHTKKEKNDDRKKGTLCVTILANDLNLGNKGKPNQAVVAFEFPPKRDVANIVKILEKLDQPAIVETFSMDMNDAYREAVQTILPKCRIIVDRYHLVQSLNDKVKRVATNLYYQKRDEARAQLKQLIDSETVELGDEIDKANESGTEEIESVFENESTKKYRDKLHAIKTTTDAQKAAKKELEFLAQNYCNRWFVMNPETFSDYGKARFARLTSRYPEFFELYKWKELLRFNFFEAETAEEARKIADIVEKQIPGGKIYRPLKTYFKTLNRSDWTDYIYDYFTEPVGKRYNNAAMEEFNRDVKEINRNAKGLTPSVLLYKVLFGDITYHYREKHLTKIDIDRMMSQYCYFQYKDGETGALDNLISFNTKKFSGIAVKHNIVPYPVSVEYILKELYYNDNVFYEERMSFIDDLVLTENDSIPAVKLYEPYPVFVPFPLKSGNNLSDAQAFIVLSEDVDALTTNKVKYKDSVFTSRKFDDIPLIPTNLPILYPEDA